MSKRTVNNMSPAKRRARLKPSMGAAISALSGLLMVCTLLLNTAHATVTTHYRIDPSRAMPEEQVEDMRVKVLGGSIAVNRFYRVMKRTSDLRGYPGVSGAVGFYHGNSFLGEAVAARDTGLGKRQNYGVWQFHRRWHDLVFLGQSGSGFSNLDPSAPVIGAASGNGEVNLVGPKYIDRNDYIYERKQGENYYVYDRNGNDLRITLSEDGYRWSNRKGDWIEYDENGIALKSGDKNGVTITLVRQGGLITQYLDHTGRAVLTWTYAIDKPIKVTDYTGRSVEYEWDDDFLVGVTTTRDHKWTYEYQNFGTHKVMVSKTDPENQTFTYEFGVSKGGFQAPSSLFPDTSEITLLGDNLPVGAASGSSSGGSRSGGGAASAPIAVEPMLMYIGKIYPDGKRTRYQYRYDRQSQSYMILSTDSDGVERERWYDLDGQTRYSLVGGRVAGIRIRNGDTAVRRDAYGNRTVYQYNRFEAVESIAYADGTSVSYQYLPNYNFPTLEVDQIGIETKHEYDFSGNRIRTTYASNTEEPRVTEYDYDAFGQMTAMRIIGNGDTPTTQMRYEYDNSGNVTKYTDGEGNITRYQDYDATGQYKTMIDARGNQWKYTYDSAGNQLTSTTPLGFISTYEYDTLHRVERSVDAENRNTAYQYDSRNHYIEITNNAGDKVRFTRRMDGQIKQSIDEIGRTMDYRYDRVGRVLEMVDAVGNSRQLHYLKQDEVVGRRIEQIDTPNTRINLTYDPLFRLIEQTQVSIKDADQDLKTTTRISYTPRGERASITDPNGNTTQWQYNAHREPIAITNAEGEVIRNVYDVRGNLRSVTDAINQTYRYTYNLNSLTTQETRPQGEQQSYAYDANNNQIRFTDYNGNIARYQYDGDNRQIQESNTKAGATNPERTINISFDKTDLITRVAHETSQVDYRYDELARLTEQTTTFYTGGAPIVKTLTQSFDKNSDLRSKIDAEGITHTFSYDPAGKFRQVNIESAGAISVTAYEGDLIKALSFPGGLTRSYEYDGLSRLTGINVKDNADNSKLDYAYRYDEAGNILEKNTQQGSHVYTYDRAYRLTNAEQPNSFGDQAYSYDDNSNRIQQNNAEGTKSYSYNGNNELISIETTLNDSSQILAMAYDANGALISETSNTENKSYAYNGFGRLESISENSTEIAQYQYDHQGRRLSKTVNGETTYFLYDDSGAGLVGEYDQAGNLLRGYSYNPSGYYSTNPVSYKTPKQGGGYEFAYYQNDHLGTPQQLISSSGAIQWQADYDAFGQATITAQNVTNNHRFPGQYFDQESELHQNWNRYYSAGSGRYISSDPIGLDGGINTFGYVGGNPIAYFDHNGLRIVSSGINIFGFEIGIFFDTGIDGIVFFEGVADLGIFVDYPSEGFSAIDPADIVTKPIGFNFTSACNRATFDYDGLRGFINAGAISGSTAYGLNTLGQRDSVGLGIHLPLPLIEEEARTVRSLSIGDPFRYLKRLFSNDDD